MTRDNVVVIMSDQHRADALGAAGHSVVCTPNLDRLASEGVRFARAYCQGPLCMPSRASFLTERYVRDHGVFDNTQELAGELPTSVQNLRDAGYWTSCIGKMHFYGYGPRGGDTRDYAPVLSAMGFSESLELPGKMASRAVTSPYDDYLRQEGLLESYREWMSSPPRLWEAESSPLPPEAYVDSWVGQKTVEWIDSYDRSQPFFLQVGFPGPHSPWDAPHPYVERYRDADISPTIGPPPSSPADGPLKRFLDIWYPMRSIPPGVADDCVTEIRRHYYGAITLIDEWVGAMVAALERRGLLDNTWVIYTSDHGEMMGDHRMFEKVVFYEPSVRVPLIIRPPGGVAARVEDGIVEQLDVAATVRAIANAPPLARAEGQSLLPRFREGVLNSRQVAKSENHGFAAFIEKRWKLVVWEDTLEPVQLFDLQDDPREDANLVADSAMKTVGQRMLEQHARPFLAQRPRRRGPLMVDRPLTRAKSE